MAVGKVCECTFFMCTRCRLKKYNQMKIPLDAFEHHRRWEIVILMSFFFELVGIKVFHVHYCISTLSLLINLWIEWRRSKWQRLNGKSSVNEVLLVFCFNHLMVIDLTSFWLLLSKYSTTSFGEKGKDENHLVNSAYLITQYILISIWIKLELFM